MEGRTKEVRWVKPATYLRSANPLPGPKSSPVVKPARRPPTIMFSAARVPLLTFVKLSGDISILTVSLVGKLP
jgi:hypothetical protein